MNRSNASSEPKTFRVDWRVVAAFAITLTVLFLTFGCVTNPLGSTGKVAAASATLAPPAISAAQAAVTNLDPRALSALRLIVGSGATAPAPAAPV